MQWKRGELIFDDAIANEFNAPEEHLLQAKTGQVDIVCTQGHWLAALDKKGNLFGKQAEHAKSTRSEIPLSAKFVGGKVELPDWQIKLFVAIQADGHYVSDCRNLRFRFSRPRKIERMRQLLAESGLDWKERCFPSEPDVTVFTICDFPEWMENRKVWSKECLTWGPRTLDVLVSELIHWDGSRCGPGSIEYVTTIPENAEWIATLAHLTGRAATISARIHPERQWATAFRVFIRDASCTRIMPKDWTDLGPAGKVYCPTSKQGVCLFRHRGTIFISKQTGRWSGDAGVNFQNMRKKPLFINESGQMETNEARINAAIEEKEETGQYPAWVLHAIDFRAIVIPRPGKKMILSDLAQIEPRVLAYLCGNKELLEKIRGGLGVYEAFARTNMGFTGEWNKKADYYKRTFDAMRKRRRSDSRP
jgi:hypothetical protein